MRKKTYIFAVGLIAAVIVAFYNLPSHAEVSVEDLKKQIEQLQKRVDELESSTDKEPQDDSLGYFNTRVNRSWDPFAEMHRMQDVVNRMFQHSFSNRGWSNGGIFTNSLNFDNEFDLKETKDGYEITFDMAGFDEEKVDIQIDEHSITVKGEQSSKKVNEDKDRYFSSQSYGSFMRTIPLPQDADTTKVKTDKKGNRLVIRLPKKVS